MTYLGIDPGQNGGFAELCDGRVIVNSMMKTERDIWDWISARTHENGIFAVIEQVHSMPGQGVSSCFTFGKGYGGLRMALIAAGIPFHEVTPQKWQKALSIPPRKKSETKTTFKNRLKAKAQTLYPKVTVTLAVADALLIMTYCRMLRTGGKS